MRVLFPPGPLLQSVFGARTEPDQHGARPAWPGAVVGRAWSVFMAVVRSRRGTTGDAVMAGVLTLLFLGHPQTLVMPLVAGLGLAATVPLVLARRFPVPCLVLVLTADAVFIVFGRLSWPLPAVGGWLLALGLCPILLPRRSAFAALGLCEVVVVCAAVLSSPRNFTPWDATCAEVLAVLTAWGVGESARARRRSRVEKGVAAVLVQRLRERDAVARERAAIARELHDVVAHHVSLIAVRAGTAPYGQPDLPQLSRAAFEEIAEHARTALSELRTVLGVLRAEDAGVDQAPQPGLADLPELMRRMEASGTQVTMEITGQARPLPEPVELCGYRVVQESLTNASRHSPGSRARVELDYGDEDLLVVIRDDGPSCTSHAPTHVDSSSPRPAGRGYGLIGMRERVAMLDGSLDVGPDPAGGFTVTARLPLAVDVGTYAAAATAGGH